MFGTILLGKEMITLVGKSSCFLASGSEHTMIVYARAILPYLQLVYTFKPWKLERLHRYGLSQQRMQPNVLLFWRHLCA